ncbi:Protein FAM168A [Microtus ochrogaster]|uniref:Protein FAM168A n=1 Tax=Microtus ochrogaster TaxID=79684 RepID=A0A8J6KZJ9_MICOH|nr:Protein FAM168A [Microtus ochrogaster]
MNPVYSPVQPGAPYGNPKNMAYTGYPTAYPAAAPAYNPSLYPTNSPSYAPATLLMKQAWPQSSSSCGTEGTFHLPVDTGTENRTYQASSAAFRYTAGTPYKVPPTQSNTAPPPYSPSPNPYQTAMYPIRSAYPQQNLYAQGAYYTQPVYAAQPHVIHHTTVVQPNSIPSAIYPAPVAAPRTNGVAMGMVAGTTMAMSAGTLLTTPQHTAIGAHPVSMPTYRAQGTPAYSYVPPHCAGVHMSVRGAAMQAKLLVTFCHFTAKVKEPHSRRELAVLKIYLPRAPAASCFLPVLLYDQEDQDFVVPTAMENP